VRAADADRGRYASLANVQPNKGQDFYRPTKANPHSAILLEKQRRKLMQTEPLFAEPKPFKIGLSRTDSALVRFREVNRAPFNASDIAAAQIAAAAIVGSVTRSPVGRA
jgi:hypothetical protein